MEYTALLNEVISLVKRVSAIMLRHDFEITEKGNVVNIVTSADIAVQSFLEKELPVPPLWGRREMKKRRKRSIFGSWILLTVL